jgi:hypothetical protein
VLADGEFTVGAAGRLLLRDLQGSWFVWVAGHLRPCDARTAGAELARLVQACAGMATDVQASGRRRRGAPRKLLDSRDRLTGLLHQCLDGDTLAPGSYFGDVPAAPWLCDLGLDVLHHWQHHFVIGRLGAEDFVR